MRRITISVALTSIILGIGSGCLSGCRRPGQGEKAEAGYKNARPIIAALKQYHDKHDQYPLRLRDLVPNELEASAWKTPDGRPVDEFFEYHRSGVGYQLQFSYTGPGMNFCVYTPEGGEWQCVGHY